RCLHSFPARRSSDLVLCPRSGAVDALGVGGRTAVAGGGVLRPGQGPGRVGRAPGADVDLLVSVELVDDGRLRVRGRVSPGRTWTDRKSTRLNSSHVS